MITYHCLYACKKFPTSFTLLSDISTIGDKDKKFAHAGSYLIEEAVWSVGGSEASNRGLDPLALERSLPCSLESIFGHQGSNCILFEKIFAKDGWVIDSYIEIILNQKYYMLKSQ